MLIKCNWRWSRVNSAQNISLQFKRNKYTYKYKSVRLKPLRAYLPLILWIALCKFVTDLLKYVKPVQIITAPKPNSWDLEAATTTYPHPHPHPRMISRFLCETFSFFLINPTMNIINTNRWVFHTVTFCFDNIYIVFSTLDKYSILYSICRLLKTAGTSLGISLLPQICLSCTCRTLA